MIYTQEELPESVFKSLLAAPHAQKIFTSVYHEVWGRYEHTRRFEQNKEKLNALASARAWKAVREAYGVWY